MDLTKRELKDIGKEATSVRLARLIKAIDLDVVSESALAVSKNLVLDNLGCMLGGAMLPQGKTMMDIHETLSGPGMSSVAGYSKKMRPLNAGYLNAYLANLLDYDDTYFGHPGSTIIPPALALGEALGLSGRQFLAAVIAAYEIGLRIADAIKPSRSRLKQVMGLSTWQTLCAGAVAAKLMNLDHDKTVHALSLAAINAPVPSVRKLGLLQGRAHYMKNNYGWASMGGMLAGITAQNGYIGDPTIFDGPTGFWKMAGSDRCRSELLTDALPEKWAVERVSIKPYSACRHIHPTLDAIHSLMRSNKLDTASIKTVDVYTFFEISNNYNFKPKEPFSIPFSAPYLISFLLLNIETGLEWFNPAYLSNKDCIKFAEKVRLHTWKEADNLYSKVKRKLISRVKVTTFKGRIYQTEIRLPKGDPQNPLTQEELKAKFFSLAEPVIGESCASEICEMVDHLERVPECSQLGKKLRPRYRFS